MPSGPGAIQRGGRGELVAEEAVAAPTSQDVAAACDVFITMLRDSPDVQAVCAGQHGAFEAP